MRHLCSLSLILFTTALSSALGGPLDSAPCQTAWKRTPALKALEPWKTEAPLKSEEAQRTWEGWSSDLLLHLSLILRQEAIPPCSAKSSPLTPLADGLEYAYLRKLGLEGLVAAERPTAFRAFLATREDHPMLVEKLKGSSSENALERAKHVYGWAALFRGTAVVASRAVLLEGLERFLKELCPRECLFWDPAFLYKLLVTDHGGLAAYVPETASLVVSRSLLETLTPLHRLILVHELTHSAVRRAEGREGKRWDAEFTALSGWGTEGLEPVVWAPARGDALSQIKADGFSLAPDPVVGAMAAGKKKFEGFPLGRTPTRVAGSGDLSEDLADAAAAYAVAPERYCFEGKPIAPKKYRWVAERLFGTKKNLSCPKAKPKKRRKK